MTRTFTGKWISGLEMKEPGYRRFVVRPVPGGGLSYAECEHRCPYGLIHMRWEQAEDRFTLKVSVPEGTVCEAALPDGRTCTLSEGDHVLC
ncbi:MAG: hypothetical protein IJL78_04775 [Lachnospiraceae bacterium]|nr:hypothetical protein [Lachnospiraceae bacterium]